jgi:hypothetical protein
MNKLIKSILKTAVYFLDQSDRLAGNMRERVADGLDTAADQASNLRDRVQNLAVGEDHTLRHVLTFAAGVGVGVGAAILLAPASGAEIRGQIGDKVHDISGRVRDRFSSDAQKTATGTEGI